MQGVFALLLGKTATVLGLETAADLSAAVLAAFGILAIVLTTAFVRPARS